MTTNEKPSPKRVVYLWGAGATHAEAQHLGASVSLLMRDNRHFGEGIATRILKRLGSKVASSFSSEQGIDIEKLISLLGGSGVDSHTQLAEKMRKSYFAELRTSLGNAKVRDKRQSRLEEKTHETKGRGLVRRKIK